MGGFYPPRGRILMCLKIILFLLCLMSYVKSFSMGKLASLVCRASRKSQSLPIYLPQTNNLSVWGVMMTKSQIWQFALMRTWASWSCDRHGALCLLTAVPIHTLPHGPYICLPGFKFRRQRVAQHLRSLSFHCGVPLLQSAPRWTQIWRVMCLHGVVPQCMWGTAFRTQPR